MEDYRREQKKLQELSKVKDLIETDALGWVSNEYKLDRYRAVIQSIKEELIEYSCTEIEKNTTLSHFPFDDHKENV